MKNVKTFNRKGASASYTEGARLVDECAELAEYYKTSRYNLKSGCQLTLDNVDIVLKNKLGEPILSLLKFSIFLGWVNIITRKAF